MGLKEQIRRKLSAERRRRHSRGLLVHDRLVQGVTDLECLDSAAVLAAYIATDGEPDVAPLLRSWCAAGRMLWLPRYREAEDCYGMASVSCFSRDLAPGHYGIPEPISTRADVPVSGLSAPGVVWLVPGVAFDSCGGRLGRGKGYYDRLLAGATGVRVGLAWEWQLIASVPMAATDEPMDWVVTEERTIACGGRVPSRMTRK